MLANTWVHAFSVTEAMLAPGTPALPLRLLERPHASGAWVANSTASPGHGAADPAAADAGMPEGGEGGDEARVAAEDPLCGLLQMQARRPPGSKEASGVLVMNSLHRNAHLGRRPLGFSSS